MSDAFMFGRDSALTRLENCRAGGGGSLPDCLAACSTTR